MYRRYVKRILDVTVACIMLVALFPFLALIALIIKLDSKGPVLFTQKRLGMNEVPFQIYKFRTMRTDAPSEMATNQLHQSGRYITRAGVYLRTLSLDELPQLYNIIIGDMSFVGFRPCLWNEFELDEERRKTGAYAVRPGITGLAQIRGRDELEPREKAKLDGVYARNVGFDYDLRILTKTVFAVFYKEGYHEGGA
ncbi:MAG: sugar transferase [Clostridia bacterium]|nr:sugar transferase [Clostridia bacterium]MBR6008553.1 sugar transferase [Clostridia bacterium]